jgi:hypothetical protein
MLIINAEVDATILALFKERFVEEDALSHVEIIVIIITIIMVIIIIIIITIIIIIIIIITMENIIIIIEDVLEDATENVTLQEMVAEENAMLNANLFMVNMLHATKDAKRTVSTTNGTAKIDVKKLTTDASENVKDKLNKITRIA